MTLEKKFRLGRRYLKQGNKKHAEEMFDLCLVHLSKETLNGLKEIEGVSINLWKTRVWTAIEKAGFLPN